MNRLYSSGAITTPNSSSMSETRVTIASESHVATEAAFARTISSALRLGKTVRKHSRSRSSTLDIAGLGDLMREPRFLHHERLFIKLGQTVLAQIHKLREKVCQRTVSRGRMKIEFDFRNIRGAK